jgi:hypothetical protein
VSERRPVGRPRKSEDLAKVIALRLDSKLVELIDAAAKAEKLTRTAWIEMVATKEILARQATAWPGTARPGGRKPNNRMKGTEE